MFSSRTALATGWITLTVGAVISIVAFILGGAHLALADSNSIDFESTYTAGSVSGQDGWSATGPYDQSIVSSTSAALPISFGSQAFRISNAVTSGSFGDQTFSKSLTNSVGETSSTAGAYSVGTRENHFEMQFDIASMIPGEVQTGLVVSVSPDRGDGSRMSYLRFEDKSDGIHVFFDDVPGADNPANWVETDVATISRSAPHTIRLTLDAVEGPSNDVVKVYIDGLLVKTGTSWENYFRYDTEASAEQTPRIVKNVLFRAGGSAAPGTLGNGFLFDNLTLSATTETLPTPPTFTSSPVTSGTVGTAYTYNVTTSGSVGTISASGFPSGLSFVDNGDGTAVLSGAPVATGDYSVVVTDTNGAGNTSQNFTLHVMRGPLVWYVNMSASGTGDGLSDEHAFTTIDTAVAAASAGDTVHVAAGTYDSFSVSGKSNLTIVGAGKNVTIVSPSTLVSTSVTHKYTSNVQASVFVNNSTDIHIQDMTIQSNSLTPGAGGPDAIVFWNASTGSLKNCAVTGTYAISGAQTGQGIAVDANGSQVATLSVDNCAISGFQKNGIDAINGNGATSGATGSVTVTVTGGSLAGAGATAAIAQNGMVLWNRAGGAVSGSVTGTTVSGFAYTPGTDSATGILAYGGGTLTSVTGASFSGNDYHLSTVGSPAITATKNYWGSADGPAPANLDGDITFSPWYSDEAMTTLRYTTSTSGDEASTTISSATNGSESTPNGDVEFAIAAGTVITGPSTWDGTVHAPTVTSTVVEPIPDTGNTATVVGSIELGFGDTLLTLDKAVQIVFKGQAGHDIGYSHGTGTFTQITTTCTDNTQGTNDGLAAGADCKIETGGDLVVWTKHFSTFTTYTQTAISNGGGGGSRSASSVTTTTGTVDSGSTTGQVLGVETYNFSNDLTIGSTGDDVIELQKVLIAAGYLNIATPTGYFGALTKSAVKLYQGAHGVITTGFVGPLTRTVLNQAAPVSIAADGQLAKLKLLLDLYTQVLALQKQLGALAK